MLQKDNKIEFYFQKSPFFTLSALKNVLSPSAVSFGLCPILKNI